MPAGDALLIPRRHLRHRPEASGGPLNGQELVGELRSRLPGCGLPSACRGDTSVTSQHSTSLRLVAPYESRRRSSGGISGAVVCKPVDFTAGMSA